MKIAVAQTRPIEGDIARNIQHHKTLINIAVAYDADMIVFPELSITGYEPTLAKDLATDKDDVRLDVFQQISDAHTITIGVGAPIKNNAGISIGMVVFQPNKERKVYYKKYLHSDEEAFFVSNENTIGLIGPDNNIALAICYEMAVPAHSEEAFKSGATIYMASVAKTEIGVHKAFETLADIAAKYSMTVLMANCIGFCDDFESAGNTAIWNNKGILSAKLDDDDEGILILDTDTQKVKKKVI